MTPQFDLSCIPQRSWLRGWVDSLSITEIPNGFQVAMGLSLVGFLLGRNLWFNQAGWKVYPNLSLLLVGPSGCGKDTVINHATRMCHRTFGDEFLMERVIQGKTMELLNARLAALGDPAVAVVKAPELTALLGGKDYQKSMVQEITDLLSTNDVLDASVKSEKRVIYKPTISLWGGSTSEWLQKAMPEGSMVGGFFPRILIVVEGFSQKFCPMPYYDMSRKDAVAHGELMAEVSRGLWDIKARFHREVMVHPSPEAQDMYHNWYVNRFEMFSPRTREYANRSRDMILKIAMICAASCARTVILDEDMEFAFVLMDRVAETLDEVVKVQSMDDKIMEEVWGVLPATTVEIIDKMGRGYNKAMILNLLTMYRGLKKLNLRDGMWSKV